MENETFSYLLKSVRKDMTGYNGFKYPEKGMVKPDKWDPAPTCQDGIFGFLDGCGDGMVPKWFPDDKWLVLKVNTKDIVPIEGGTKVKVPRAEVVFVGDVFQATAFLESVAPHTKNMPVIGANRAIQGAGNVVVGHRGVATAGDEGVATAGRCGTAIAGIGGTAVAGGGGTATAGDYGTATAECGGTATAGYGGTATAGYNGTAIAGTGGIATAGRYGTAIAGIGGTAIVGGGGRAIAGRTGKVKGGAGATLQLTYRDDINIDRYRVAVAYVGENGILADTFYIYRDGQFKRADC